jgi:hypothetical protein
MHPQRNLEHGLDNFAPQSFGGQSIDTVGMGFLSTIAVTNPSLGPDVVS